MARELAELLPEGRVQQVRQPHPEAVTLTVRVPGETLHLRLEPQLRAAWVGLAPDAGPTTTPMPRFLALLRHDLTAARVVSVSLPWEDRIVRLAFSGPAGARALILELGGHHPNLFLTDPEGTILDLLLPSRSFRRDLVPGRPYVSPAGTGVRQGEGDPRIGPDHPSPARAAAALFLAAAEVSREAAERGALLRDLDREARRVARTLGRVEQDLARVREGLALREGAELLKTRLDLVRRGMTAVDLEDWAEPGRVIRVPLDPRRGPAENLEALFARYRKARRAEDRVRDRGRTLATRGQELEALAARAREAAAPELAEIRARAALPVPREGKSGPTGATRRPWYEFTSVTGHRILVGRSAADNRILTFQEARGHDAWLHVRGVPGSHVVIPLSRGREPDLETLLDAAHLAIRYSRSPDADAGEVAWTWRRHVRPAAGANPGAVFVSRERSLSIRVDPERVRRLAATRV